MEPCLSVFSEETTLHAGVEENLDRFTVESRQQLDHEWGIKPVSLFSGLASSTGEHMNLGESCMVAIVILKVVNTDIGGANTVRLRDGPTDTP